MKPFEHLSKSILSYSASYSGEKVFAKSSVLKSKIQSTLLQKNIEIPFFIQGKLS